MADFHVSLNFYDRNERNRNSFYPLRIDKYRNTLDILYIFLYHVVHCIQGVPDLSRQSLSTCLEHHFKVKKLYKFVAL